jgi:transcriptional regulator with XRE-family HTH domain
MQNSQHAIQELSDNEDGKRRGPHPIDLHVGERIRLRRKILKMSQSQLAERIGITFQQVQKYEKGTNRVGAGRLYDIASILGVDVSFFFHELKSSDYTNPKNPSERSGRIRSQPHFPEFGSLINPEADPITSNETLKLLQFYNRMNEEGRQQVLSLCQFISKNRAPTYTPRAKRNDETS